MVITFHATRCFDSVAREVELCRSDQRVMSPEPLPLYRRDSPTGDLRQEQPDRNTLANGFACRVCARGGYRDNRPLVESASAEGDWEG